MIRTILPPRPGKLVLESIDRFLHRTFWRPKGELLGRNARSQHGGTLLLPLNEPDHFGLDYFGVVGRTGWDAGRQQRKGRWNTALGRRPRRHGDIGITRAEPGSDADDQEPKNEEATKKAPTIGRDGALETHGRYGLLTLEG